MIAAAQNTIEVLQNYPANARVWIYQSNRNLLPHEVEAIQNAGNNFVAEWNAHGAAMKSAFLILYNRFLVLVADESAVKASGCSIDSSVRLIRQVEQAFGIQLLDRLNLAYRNSSGEVCSLQMDEFRKKIETGEITGDTIVFNNLAETVGQMKTEWEVAASKSWHKQLL
jgi:hypothetical protein